MTVCDECCHLVWHADMWSFDRWCELGLEPDTCERSNDDDEESDGS